MSVAATPGFDVLVWYPTQVPEVGWQIGPFAIAAGHNAEVAAGSFPIVVLSHGGGATGGSPLLLGDLSSALARAGFIVVAPFHGKSPLAARAIQMRLALDAMRSDPRFKPHAASDRLGLLGFSLGGAVVLRLVGAVPAADALTAYCMSHRDDVQSCNGGPAQTSGVHTPPEARSADAPLPVSPSSISAPGLSPAALVLLDPFTVLFDHASLSRIDVPVLTIRPKDSQEGEENTRLLTSDLGKPPDVQYIAGGHFIFTDVCPATLKETARQVCDDAAGVDRASIHSEVEAYIIAFFRRHLVR